MLLWSTVQTIGILTGGKNYNIGDRVLFDNSLDWVELMHLLKLIGSSW